MPTSTGNVPFCFFLNFFRDDWGRVGEVSAALSETLMSFFPPYKFSHLFLLFSAGLICLYLNFIFLWWEVGWGWGGLVALLLPSVHTLINNGGVKYVTNNNNNNNETICKPVVIVVTQTCAKGLCMYLNVRFRGLFQNMFCFSVFWVFFLSFH